MERASEDSGKYGERAAGPPWILGHRGAPRDAPENTLASLTLAIDAGLDGVEYDLHGCATGEPVLLHDETLDRTTNGHGPIAQLTLPELAGIDAGGWFNRRFRGEPLPLLEEALDLPGNDVSRLPQHMIELKDPGLVREVARQLKERAEPLPIRVASFRREVCLEARDLDLPTMLLATDADEADRRFVRDERITAYGTGPGGWRTLAGREEWSCERWSWSVDDPCDLLAACRMPLNGFNTNEPQRALAVRALVFLTPHDEGSYPLTVPPLEVPTGGVAGPLYAKHGEWAGRWRVPIGVRNPLAFAAKVKLGLVVRGGAFEVEGLPAEVSLAAGASASLDVSVAGGSWSPRDDPVVLAHYSWVAGPGQPERKLILDAPLVRMRRLHVGADTVRLEMLAEHPGDDSASMTVKRRGNELLAWVENPGGLEDARAMIRVGAEVRTGGRGARLRLPEDFDHGPPQGFAFGIGFMGREPNEHGPPRLRRWAGGLPYGLRGGAPARLHPAKRI